MDGVQRPHQDIHCQIESRPASARPRITSQGYHTRRLLARAMLLASFLRGNVCTSNVKSTLRNNLNAIITVLRAVLARVSHLSGVVG